MYLLIIYNTYISVSECLEKHCINSKYYYYICPLEVKVDDCVSVIYELRLVCLFFYLFVFSSYLPRH